MFLWLLNQLFFDPFPDRRLWFEDNVAKYLQKLSGPFDAP